MDIKIIDVHEQSQGLMDNYEIWSLRPPKIFLEQSQVSGSV